VAAASTDAAANGLDTNTELCGNGSLANSAGLVGGADGGTPRGMDCRPTDRLAALGALGPGPRHATTRSRMIARSNSAKTPSI
jgi:hypothetical protein